MDSKINKLDGGSLNIVAQELKKCADSWQPKARLLGNVRAEDISRLCEANVSMLAYVKSKIEITEQMQKEDSGIDPAHSQFLSGLWNAYDDIRHELENGDFKL